MYKKIDTLKIFLRRILENRQRQSAGAIYAQNSHIIIKEFFQQNYKGIDEQKNAYIKQYSSQFVNVSQDKENYLQRSCEKTMPLIL